MKTLFALFAVLSVSAQDMPHTKQYFYTSSILTAVCEAASITPQTTLSVAGSTVTNVVVASNVGTVTANAHGFWRGARFTLSGSATSALNAVYTVATVPDANSFTITTSGVSDGTYTTGITIGTNAPLLNAPLWQVTIFTYDGSGNIENIHLGGGSLSGAYKAKCSDRGLY